MTDAALPPDDMPTREHTARCRAMYAQAILLYCRDAQAAAKGRDAYHGDAGEALDDLTSRNAPALAALCYPLDLCPKRARTAILAILDSGQRIAA